jgi:hypothetical protein
VGSGSFVRHTFTPHPHPHSWPSSGFSHQPPCRTTHSLPPHPPIHSSPPSYPFNTQTHPTLSAPLPEIIPAEDRFLAPTSWQAPEPSPCPLTSTRKRHSTQTLSIFHTTLTFAIRGRDLDLASQLPHDDDLLRIHVEFTHRESPPSLRRSSAQPTTQFPPNEHRLYTWLTTNSKKDRPSQVSPSCGVPHRTPARLDTRFLIHPSYTNPISAYDYRRTWLYHHPYTTPLPTFSLAWDITPRREEHERRAPCSQPR